MGWLVVVGLKLYMLVMVDEVELLYITSINGRLYTGSRWLMSNAAFVGLEFDISLTSQLLHVSAA